MVRQEILDKQKARQLRKQQRLKQQRRQERRIRKAEESENVKINKVIRQPPVKVRESIKPEDWFSSKSYKSLKDWQLLIANRRQKDRIDRRLNLVKERKKQIVEKYGIEPTICYFYYLWNAIDYAGEKYVRESFESIAGQGDEVILADYGSTDGTQEIAKEYGIRVVNVEKTPGIQFHMSKLVNKVLVETECNFIVDLSIHTTYPKNFDAFFRNWVQNNDITEKQLAVRGLMVKGERLVRRYAAALCMYRPFLLESRGYDERTYYGYGTTPYILDLLLSVWGLVWDDHPLDFIHKQHNHFKMPNLKKEFGDNMNIAHTNSLIFAETLIDKIYYNFDEGVRQVKNSYINDTKVFGIGLPKSGTTSLKTALQMLGYKAAQFPQPPLVPDLYNIAYEHDYLCDVPIAHAYKELDQYYKKSKFILNIRDLKSWLKSCKSHKTFHFPIPENYHPDIKKMLKLFYGCEVFDEEKWTDTYFRHHKEVMEYFKNRPDDLLVINVIEGDGWEQICPFLDRIIPDTDFPHELKTKIKNIDYTKK